MFSERGKVTMPENDAMKPWLRASPGERGVAAEAVHHSPAPGNRRNCREHLVVRVAVVDEHGLAGVACELEHQPERTLLDVERHLVVPGAEEQIEPNLPHRDRLGMAEQFGQRIELRSVGRCLLMRMPAAREVHAVVLLGDHGGCDRSRRG